MIPSVRARTGSAGALRSAGGSLEDALHLMSRRWTLPILETLERGSLRRSRLEHDLGEVSPPVLTSTLRCLTVAGLVSRRQVSARQVDYQLTDRGRLALGVVRTLRPLVGTVDVRHGTLA